MSAYGPTFGFTKPETSGINEYVIALFYLIGGLVLTALFGFLAVQSGLSVFSATEDAAGYNKHFARFAGVSAALVFAALAALSLYRSGRAFYKSWTDARMDKPSQDLWYRKEILQKVKANPTRFSPSDVRTAEEALEKAQKAYNEAEQGKRTLQRMEKEREESERDLQEMMKNLT